jgi:hypothetical protein
VPRGRDDVGFLRPGLTLGHRQSLPSGWYTRNFPEATNALHSPLCEAEETRTSFPRLAKRRVLFSSPARANLNATVGTGDIRRRLALICGSANSVLCRTKVLAYHFLDLLGFQYGQIGVYYCLKEV